MKDKELGFTLVELMIVVAIVGILAVLATYGVRKYIANAKTTEARNSLGQIAKDAATSYEMESMSNTILVAGSSTGILRNLCASATSPVPANGTFIQGQKYQSSKQDWSSTTDLAASPVQGWPCVKFEIDAPQYFMYAYSGTTGTGGSFSSTANGDLNGDGTLSTFSITGSVNSAGLLNTAPSIQEVAAEE